MSLKNINNFHISILVCLCHIVSGKNVCRNGSLREVIIVLRELMIFHSVFLTLNIDYFSNPSPVAVVLNFQLAKVGLSLISWFKVIAAFSVVT